MSRPASSPSPPSPGRIARPPWRRNSAASGRRRSWCRATPRPSPEGGGRLLRRWLSQPLLDLAALEQRHDAVGEFVAQAAARAETRALLQRIGDLERLTGRTVAGTVGPRELHVLRTTLGLVPELC